jgi:SAM-dependent methyltransferase
MISEALIHIAACPDCRGRLDRFGDNVRCTECRRVFETTRGYLDLRPMASFAEQTKYLDAALHADARHESIAPPLLGSKIRNDTLRRFLELGPGDRAIDLGCGSGRTLAWNAATGAALCGIDVSPYFAEEALRQSDLVLGDLRRLPLGSASFHKAWSLDVLEHLSPGDFREVLSEARRVLRNDGALFVYTHVRKNGWVAGGVRVVNRLASLCERVGLTDLGQERLRKSDHLNPIADHDELNRVVAECGFRVERITYYTPVIGAFVENILIRIGERWLTKRAARTVSDTADREGAAMRTVRSSVQARVRDGGALYVLLFWASVVMKLDILLFGRFRSGPFFALLRKVPEGQDAGRAGRRDEPTNA